MYEGRPVIMASITIPNAGGGLHEALGLDPVLLYTGDEVDVLLRCTAGKITHDPIVHKGEDTGNYNRVVTLHADKGTIVVDKAVGDRLFTKLSTRLQAAELERRKQAAIDAKAAAGEVQIPGTEDA
jgi:hypothetical protein